MFQLPRCFAAAPLAGTMSPVTGSGCKEKFEYSCRYRFIGEDISAQELVAKLAVRIILSACFEKLGQPLVSGMNIRRRDRKQLPPVGAGMKWTQFSFDHRQQAFHCRPVLLPSKMNGYARLLVARTHPEVVGGNGSNL